MTLPTLFINLDRSADRRARSIAFLNTLGLAWERVPGVDGLADLSVEQRQSINPPCRWGDWFRPLTPGEIGCFLSHLRCWQRVVEAGWPYALILEDDCAPAPACTQALLTELATQGSDWDLIRLSNTPASWPEHVSRPIVLLPGPGHFTNATAYLISQAGARKLVQARQAIRRPVDFDLRHVWERGLRMFAAPGFLFRPLSHEETASLIGDRSAYRRAPLLQRLGVYSRKHVYQIGFTLADRFQIGRRSLFSDLSD